MALESTKLDALQRLGVSYPQILDYSSTQYTATLVQVCILGVITWDCITTLDGEIAFFWKSEKRSRWSAARILFMVNRHLPIIGFSLHVYWRINRSLDNPLCNIKELMTYITIPMYATIEILQILRVWSLYNRSRSVGLFLLGTVICGATGSIVARTLPTPKGLPLVELASESLTGCEHETPKGFFESIGALFLETVLLTMVVLKIRESWTRIGPMPFLQAFLLHGAAYYFILGLALSLDLVASTSSMLYYPVVDTNFAVCVGVIACNHFMLSLRETRDHPTMGSSSSFSRHTADVVFGPQDVAYTFADRTRPIPLPILGRKLDERRPSDGRTAQKSLEVD